MKYLKRYNESTASDIKEFCNDYLSYLIDDGFNVEVETNYKHSEYEKKLVRGANKSHYEYRSTDMGTFLAKISINKPVIVNKLQGISEYMWDDIKDHFIPFLIFLNKTYKVEMIKFRGVNGFYTIEQILKPNFKFKSRVYLLEILINKI